MRVLIDALGARTGGGLTGFNGLVNALPQVAPEHEYQVLLAPRYQSTVIANLPRGVSCVSVPLRGAGLLERSWFQNVGLPHTAAAARADVLFVSGEAAYLRSTLPTAMLSGNLSLF